MCFLILTGGQQKTVSQSIDSDVVADGGQVLRSPAHQGAHQIFRDFRTIRIHQS